eukprot:2659441-Amphidinium_carterae.1
MVGESKKKATQEDAQRMAKKLLHSHDEIIGMNASDEEGLDEQQTAALEAGQSSFDGAGVHGVDLRNLFLDVHEEEASKPKKDAEDASHATKKKRKDGEEPSKKEEKKEEKKKKSIGLTEVTKAQSSLEAKIENMKQEMSQCIGQCKTKMTGWQATKNSSLSRLLEILGECPSHLVGDDNDMRVCCQPAVMAGCYSLLLVHHSACRGYLELLQFIRFGEKKKLRERLLEIKEEQSQGLKGRASRAVPIQQFEEVMSTSCLSSKGSFFESCTDTEGVKAVWTTHVNPAIARWREVISACKKMCADIAAVEKEQKSSKDQNQKEDREKKKRKKAEETEAGKQPFLDRFLCSEAVIAIPSTAWKDRVTGWMKEGPCLLRDAPFSKECLKTTSMHQDNYSSFQNVFMSSKTRRQVGHAQRLLKDCAPQTFSEIQSGSSPPKEL